MFIFYIFCCSVIGFVRLCQSYVTVALVLSVNAVSIPCTETRGLTPVSSLWINCSIADVRMIWGHSAKMFVFILCISPVCILSEKGHQYFIV